MAEAFQIAGDSVQLVSTISGEDEVPLPKLANGKFASTYLIQQVPSAQAVSFTFAPEGDTIAFADGPLSATNGDPQMVLVAPGVNNFVHGVNAVSTSTLIITPLAN